MFSTLLVTCATSVRRTRIVCCAVSIAVLLVTACSDGGPPPVAPVTPTTPPVSVLTSLSASSSATSISVGATTTAQVAGRDQYGAPMSVGAVAWTSNAPTIATVSSTGLITGRASGTAGIVATVGSQTAVITITVGATTPPVNPPGMTFTTPSTTFIEKNGSFGTNGFWYQELTLASSTTFVLRVVSDFAIDAAILTPGQLSAFTTAQSFTGYAIFDNQVGTSSVTLPSGRYYVAVRNQSQGNNSYRIELDYDIQLRPEQGYSFTFVDNYLNQTQDVAANGGRLWQPFTIQSGFRYLLDGASINVDTFIIQASELSNFQNGRAFNYYTDYGGNGDPSNPGLWELRLPPGNYFLVFRNRSALTGLAVYTMERWRVN
jgi:Bacterial Ig-like domain (group 2)